MLHPTLEHPKAEDNSPQNNWESASYEEEEEEENYLETAPLND